MCSYNTILTKQKYQFHARSQKPPRYYCNRLYKVPNLPSSSYRQYSHAALEAYWRAFLLLWRVP